MRRDNPNTREFYDAYWRAGDPGLSDWRMAAVVARIAGRLGPTPARVLDIGGGVSRLARAAKALGHSPTVLDFSRAALETMENEEIPGILCDVNEWDGTILLDVDVVTCLEVLEHLARPSRAVRLAAAHAARAFFTVPNNCMGPATNPRHVRVFDEARLLRLLRPAWEYVEIEPMHQWLVAETRA